MARACLDVAGGDVLPKFDNGVEIVFVATSLGLFSVTGSDEPHHNLTVLINLSQDKADRRVIRDSGFALNCASKICKVFSGINWEFKLREHLSGYPPSLLSTVLLLPKIGLNDDAPLLTLPRQALEVLDKSAHANGMVIAVTESPDFWRDLDSVTGFVAPGPAGRAYDANAVFAHLVTLSAPVMLTCSDLADMFDSVGRHLGSPSVVAVASWNLEARRLEFHTERDRAVVAAAESLSVSPLWPDGSWKDAHALMAQLRTLISINARYIYNVSTEFFRASQSLAGSRCVPVVIVIKIDFELWSRNTRAWETTEPQFLPEIA